MALRFGERFGHFVAVEPPGETPVGFDLVVRPPATLAWLRRRGRDGGASVERESILRSIVRHHAGVAGVDPEFGWITLEAQLGITLDRFLAQRDGSPDSLIREYIAARLTSAITDVHETCGVRAGVIDARHVWLTWDGDVQLVGPIDLALEQQSALDRDEHDLSRDWALLQELLGGRVDPVDMGTHGQAARALLASTLAGLFPAECRRDAAWQEELAMDDEVTARNDAPEVGADLRTFFARTVELDDGRGRALVVTDLVPASVAHALAARIGRGRDLPFPPSSSIATNVAPSFALQLAGTHDQRYRLPTDEEWTRLAAGGAPGRPSRAGVRGLGRVWELTSTPRAGRGWVVRGGPWRNRRVLANVANESWEDGPAADLGFRFVRERDAWTPNVDDWESRT